MNKSSLLTIICLLLGASLAFSQNKDWLIKMQDPNVNFWELQKEFNNYWKDRSDYKGNGYKVFKRWEYINEARALPNGKLPAPDHTIKAYNKYMTEVASERSTSGAWSIVGPTTYPANATSQPTGKGRLNAIAFHPSDANTIFVGASSGGIWKSVNGGANWINISANIPLLGVSAILIHPSDPNTIYIGTGDRDGNDAPGLGVYKSTDGGATWAQASTGIGNVTVGILLMHPSDPNTIIAATKSGIYKTTNAGLSWSLKQAGDFRDIKFKPGDPTVMYATRITTPSEFYRSTDTGDNWTLVATPTSGVGSRMVIGVSPANSAYVYLVQIKDTDGTFKALLRSTDSGQTFTQRSSTPNIFDYACDGSGTSSQATYDLVIEVDKSDAETLYVGSINTWKSTDGGVNWSPKTHWVGNTLSSSPSASCAVSVHADHHWFEWSPFHSPARLYLGHDGGIAYTADGGNTWTDISTDLPIGQLYKVGQSTASANFIMGGFQDNGVSATIDGTSFTTIGGGDGFDCIIDYNNSNYCYRSVNGSVSRSTTGVFGSYSGVTSGISGVASFFSDYRLHNTDPNTMFFGRYEVWRSNNIRATPSTSVSWTAISAFSNTNLIRVMEQSATNPDMMYISRGSGAGSALYRSDNVNASAGSVVWNAIPKPNSSFAVTDIAAHPTNSNIVYATAGMQVYKSANKGASWTDITGNLPALFINCLVIDKNAAEGIYIGNEAGVWYKDATVPNWILFSSGLPPVDVRELEIYYDANPANSRITAATFGRGIWQSDLAQINVAPPSNLSATAISSNQIDLSWSLNAANNNVLIATSPTTIFGIPADGTAYTAGNSLPGGGTVVYVGALTNFSHTGLSPGAAYCYKIWSVNGGNQYSAGLSPVCANTFSHNWTGNVNTDWFNTGNWGTGTVPTSVNAAYIPAGRPNYPLINAAGATCNHLTIEPGASVSMDNVNSYTLQVTGDWTNNGTFTRGAGTVVFSGTNALQTIKGSSATAFNILQVNKGALANILEVTSLITLNAASNPLVITSGTFKLSSASSITPFTSNGGADLLSSSGLWNNGGTITYGNISWFLNGGLLRVSAGTINMGTSSGNSITYLNNGTLIMEGGALTIAGRFSPNGGGSVGAYTQTGGVLTVNAVGSTSTTRAPFELNTGVPFTMSGGTIAIRRASSNTSGDIMISSATHNVTGGTLQIGDASTPTGQTIRISCAAPVYNLTVNAANAPTAQLLANGLIVKNDATISGGALDANNLNISVGGHWTNSGVFTSGAGTVTFNGTANQNLAGGNATTFNNLTLDNAAGSTLSGSVNATINGTLTLTAGVITTGSNKVILPASGTVSRTSGHIFGNLQKNVAVGSNISRTFEVGDADASNYTPVSFNFATVSTQGDLTARAVSGDHPQIASAAVNAFKSVNRYWALTNNATVFTAYDAVFNFLTTDLDPSTNTTTLLCGKYNAPNWTYPTVGTRTAVSTQITGETSFSDFQLAEPPCVNPDAPTLSASANPTCSGQSSALSITAGNLNGAAGWQWYSGSCGGAPVGSGASINVSPASTTTYYARGEGGCVVSPGSCGSVTITVNPLPNVTCPANSSVCSNAAAFTLTGGMPAGGAYSGAGVSGGMFDPSVAGVGTHTITYSYTDGNTCTATCAFSITVNACTVVSGNILWEHDGVSGVNSGNVGLSGDYSTSTTSNASGFYSLTAASGSNFMITPSKNINKTNGLTSADVTAIQQHLSNIASLPAPFKRIAADVNKSNSITTLDASLVNQALLGNTTALNQITSWRFVPASYTFPTPNVPWGFPEKITLTGVSGNVSGQNFKGIKLGDVVSAYANPANLGADAPFVLALPNLHLKANEDIAVDFTADQWDDLASFQLALHFDTERLQFRSVEALNGLPLSAEHFGAYNIAAGELRAVWSKALGVRVDEGAPVFRLHFRCLQSGLQLSDVLRLDENILPAYAYNTGLEQSNVELRFEQTVGAEDLEDTKPALRLQPNPFNKQTTAHFVLSSDTEAEIRVLDAAGRVLFSQKKYYAAGRHAETLYFDNAWGMLLIELTTATGKATQRVFSLK